MATKKAPTKKAKTPKAAVVTAEAPKPVAKASVSAPAKQLSELTPADLVRLRGMNLGLAVVLALEAAAILLFGGSKSTPITSQYLASDQLASEVSGHTVWATATRHLFDMRLSITSAKSLAVLAITCLVIATVGRAYYETQLKRGSHLARWLAAL
jgi:hypothetical protein